MFTPITLNTWPRREIFYYFSQMAPTGYSLTVSLDVTELYHTVKNAGFKFFSAYLWLVNSICDELTGKNRRKTTGQPEKYAACPVLFCFFLVSLRGIGRIFPKAYRKITNDRDFLCFAQSLP